MRFNLSLEHLAAGTLAVCIVGFTCGSSSIPAVKSDAQSLRWIPLFVLWVVGVALAARLRGLTLRGATAAVVLLGGFFVGLMLVSTSWSGDPSLTFERAVSFAIVLTATGALGVASAREPRLARLLLGGIVAGIGIVTAVGLLMLLWREGYAAQLRAPSVAWRFRGLGENPNTVSMLAGVATPIIVWAIFSAATVARRVAAGATLVMAYVTISLSGSHGAILAAFAGTIVFGLFLVPRRKGFVAVVVTTLAFFGAVRVSQIPHTTTVGGIPAPSVATSSAPATSKPGGSGAGSSKGTPHKPNHVVPPKVVPPKVVPPKVVPPKVVPPPTTDLPMDGLSSEVGAPSPGKRTLLGNSGRVQAWRGAIEQGNERPILGYGFGTEEHVFFDRYQTFEGDRPENSFVGLYLDLGLVGLVAFLAFCLSILITGMRGLLRLTGSERTMMQASLGAGVAGATVMVVQSFVYSAGDVATLTFWMCAMLLVAGRSWSSGSSS